MALAVPVEQVETVALVEQARTVTTPQSMVVTVVLVEMPAPREVAAVVEQVVQAPHPDQQAQRVHQVQHPH